MYASFQRPSKISQERRAAYDFFFQDNRDLIPGWERLRKIADRSLAGDALWAACQAYYRGEVAQAPVKELIKYATDSYRGKFFSIEYLNVYLNLISRILRSACRKLGLIKSPKGVQIA